MFDRYFAKNIGSFSVDPADFPGFFFDAEQLREAQAEAPHLIERLEAFIAWLEGTPAAPFSWDESSRARALRHPIYRSPEYSAEHFAALPKLSRAALRTRPDCFDFEASASPTLYATKTSGTSGAPLTVVYSGKFFFQILHQSLLRTAMRAGLKNLGAREIFSVVLSDNEREQDALIPDPLGLVGPSVLLRVELTDPIARRRTLEILAALNPEVITTKPNLFKMLLEAQRLEGVSGISPAFLVASGATLSPELRAQLAETYRCRVLSTYQTSELGHLAAECNFGKLHLDASMHDHFEVVDHAGRPLPLGERGELTVTSMNNDSMPLVRYGVGDMVVLRTETCACGATGPVLERLEGRVTIVFELGDGIFVSPTRWMTIFQNIPGLAEYQLTQTQRRAFGLKIELNQDVAGPARAEAISAVRRTIASGFTVPVELEVSETVFEKNGAKFARFRSEVTS